MSRQTCLFVFALLVAAFAYFVPGCDKLVTEKEVIYEAGHPIAGFIADPTSCCAPCTVIFVDSSRGPRQVWIWDYDDGASDTFTGNLPDTVRHVYDTAGIFDVSLTILDTTVQDTGWDTETKYRYITIGIVSAAFTSAPDSACIGAEITFWPPKGTISQWFWDFGDDSTATFSNTIPDSVTHTYDSAGSYWVNLTVTDSCGSRTDSRQVVIVECPTVQFAATYPAPLDTLEVTEGCIPLTVEFHDESVPPAGQVMDSWNWNFGDGQTSQLQDPTITYNDTGTYIITLTAASGGLPVTAADTISVYDSTTAVFVAETPNYSCFWPGRQFQVKFMSVSKGKIDSLFWAFGDGFYDSTQNSVPVHAYTQLGIYSCTLIVYGVCGIDTMTDTSTREDYVIYADDLDSVGFTITPDSGDTSVTFAFADTSKGLIVNRQWLIDTIAVNNAIEVLQRFSDTGWYQVTLTVSNPCDTVTKTDSVHVIP